jgi:hypothetical protein
MIASIIALLNSFLPCKAKIVALIKKYTKLETVAVILVIGPKFLRINLNLFLCP